MSWKERLENIEFTIKTGDGKTFKPLWKNSEKSKKFNTTKYDFINVEGSLIDRKKAQSNLYPLVFYFQGEDNIEQCDTFESSANDNRLWTVEHPFYGTIKGQPVDLKRNDENYNVTEVIVNFWESIDGNFPDTKSSINDEVRNKVDLLDVIIIDVFAENSNPDIGDINTLKNNATLTASKFNADDENFNDYKTVVSTGLKSTNNLLTDTKGSFESVKNIISKTTIFKNSIISKMSSYVAAYSVVKDSVDNKFSKYNFESQAAVILHSMCISCVNPIDNDYVTRNDIEEINNILINLYDDYLQFLDENQVDIHDVENSWFPDISIQSSLSNLIIFTSNSLFSLSFNARQERIVELDKDSNLIVLAHRFMGLDKDDENIELFRKINNIKNEELFKVKKGRILKYFV